MKIIKEGNLDKIKQTKRFECKICGCVFEADAGEYKLTFERNTEVAYAKCPTCKSIAYEEKRG